MTGKSVLELDADFFEGENLDGMLKLSLNNGEFIPASSVVVFETSDFSVYSLPMRHQSPCLAYSFQEKEKIRINKSKIKKLGLKGKIIGELVKGKDITWKNKKIKAKNVTYKQPGRKITIIMDTAINQNAVKIAENSDLLISESTYSESEKALAKKYQHLTASQAAEIARKAKVKKLILTHLSQRYDNKGVSIFEEARKIFKNTGNIY